MDISSIGQLLEDMLRARVPRESLADNTHVHKVEKWLTQTNNCVLILHFFNIHLEGKAQFWLLLPR